MVHHNHSRRSGDDRVEIRTVRGESESVTHTILRGLATIENVPVTELDPLYEQVEMEALDALLAHANESDAAVNIEFTTPKYTVVVTHGDRVCIHDGEPAVSTVGGVC
ncbi:HalOD1 output domain-containing protein [Natronorubrum halophilum]|uniref:HalOD1 output domain-containing protein n=1 Tax=Natronorubrum halophilum TaxID=1702106 RepID=UPI0010C1FA42|nr:HalOD1 output domain-containing protein [Natronorubrum halophilum]